MSKPGPPPPWAPAPLRPLGLELLEGKKLLSDPVVEEDEEEGSLLVPAGG